MAEGLWVREIKTDSKQVLKFLALTSTLDGEVTEAQSTKAGDQMLFLNTRYGQTHVHIRSSLCTTFSLETWVTGMGKFLIPSEVDQLLVSKLIQGSIASPSNTAQDLYT